jgi:hypothetical protein
MTRMVSTHAECVAIAAIICFTVGIIFTVAVTPMVLHAKCDYYPHKCDAFTEEGCLAICGCSYCNKTNVCVNSLEINRCLGDEIISSTPCCPGQLPLIIVLGISFTFVIVIPISAITLMIYEIYYEINNERNEETKYLLRGV